MWDGRGEETGRDREMTRRKKVNSEKAGLTPIPVAIYFLPQKFDL